MWRIGSCSHGPERYPFSSLSTSGAHNRASVAAHSSDGTDYAIIDSDYGEYPGEEVAGKISWTSMPGDTTAYIRYIEVDPGHRRHGIATALLEHLLDSQGFKGWKMLGNFATKEAKPG